MLAVLKNTLDTILKNRQILLLLLLPGIIISFSDFSENALNIVKLIYLLSVQLVLYLYLLSSNRRYLFSNLWP